MALGTITVTSQPVKAASEALQVALISVPGDGAYPTGGTTGIAALLQAVLGRLATPLFVVAAGANGGYRAIYDVANDTLLMYYGDNDNAADGPQIEVPNATDLSGVTFKLQAVCY